MQRIIKAASCLSTLTRTMRAHFAQEFTTSSMDELEELLSILTEAKLQTDDALDDVLNEVKRRSKRNLTLIK